MINKRPSFSLVLWFLPHIDEMRKMTLWLINIIKELKEDKYALHVRRGKICALCAINEGHDTGDK